jgi:hypothetical protein
VIGIVMLYRILTLPGAISPPAVLVAIAFIGFGTYRLWMARARYREYRARGTGDKL